MVHEPEVVYRLGVDVGGTNTDAVLLALSEDHKKNAVLSAHKSPTTVDVMEGIINAVSMVVKDVKDMSTIQALSIGTTHFVNALITRDPRRLEKVAVIRLCGPFSLKTPPFSGFPRELRHILGGPVFMLSGGLQIDGREIAPVLESEIIAACSQIAAAGIRAVAVASVYAPIDSVFKQEERVADLVRAHVPGALVTISKHISNIGLLDRENASILNAALLSYARKTVRGFRSAAQRLQLTCPVFITSNDGTLLTCEQAAKFPIRTFSSGPTNSMRGAAWLAQLEMGQKKGEGALVVDIGGTTTDIGMLLPTGFPRQAAARHHLCGVRLNFSMPDVVSIGLGGGSIVRSHTDDGRVTVGPDSVGYRITQEALVFGGKTLTATDVAVASGRAADVGDKSLVEHVLKEMVEKAQARIKSMLETTLDSMKTSAADIPVYLVGGGAILAPDHLDGVSRVVRFKNSGVANACGAAIAQVAGTVDTVEEISSRSIPEVRKLIEHRAMDLAIKAGANPDKVSIIESEAIPIAYTAGRCRFYVKAAGEWKGVSDAEAEATPEAEDPEPAVNGKDVNYEPEEADKILSAKEIMAYRPQVSDALWTLSELDLEWIAEGCYILGCGGGGSPHHMFLQMREAVRGGEKIQVRDLSSLPDDAVLGWGGALGSPEVADERLLGEEYTEATQELIKFMGIKDAFAGFIALEIGGANGMINMTLASSAVYGWPVIDGDFMGRAYPTSWQTTPNVYDDTGKAKFLLPSVISSGDGNIMIMTKVKVDRDHDSALRAACTEMGTFVGCAMAPLTAAYCRRAMIHNTISLSWRIGRAVAYARKSAQLGNVGNVIIDSLGGKETGRVLFSGKIIDVARSVYKGHTVGRVTIAVLQDHAEPTDGPVEQFQGTLMIPFKNENLYCELDLKDGSKPTVIATVPDLIMVVDAQNGAALGTPDYKYGLRVIIIGVTAAPQWTDTPRGLEIGDCRAFGFPEIPYKALGQYVKPRSVIEEFST
ncbi:hypothetical protein DACRYDRAFT_57377 [Dacryopinax primogenitus]|uniref:Hydantoinase n=1 Tax=Dacryopinax primogenitus (strain DJM 731) TaxID=1858805 RepID=M5FT44_DACPD|nr:uncharacterized protein DACRYDRAFT_57377 [Dacryopinax primogenitus]EJT98544.1 hypothetical protein DACRYDRAFT_57377 [Dacryopinax primogenitus]